MFIKVESIFKEFKDLYISVEYVMFVMMEIELKLVVGKILK